MASPVGFSELASLGLATYYVPAMSLLASPHTTLQEFLSSTAPSPEHVKQFPLPGVFTT